MVLTPPGDDAAVLEAVAAGDERSLAELYDRHSTRVHSLVTAMIGIPADAEEVTEDVFIQIWETAGTFDPGRGSVAAWVTTLARSRALDHLRSRKRRRERLERAAASDPVGAAVPLASAGPDPAEHAERRGLARRIGAALDRLPEDQRTVIRLAYFAGFSQSQIASRLDQPLGTVKSRTRLAMAALRDLMTGRSGGVR